MSEHKTATADEIQERARAAFPGCEVEFVDTGDNEWEAVIYTGRFLVMDGREPPIYGDHPGEPDVFFCEWGDA